MAREEEEEGEGAGFGSMQVPPVPLPRQNLPSKGSQEAADRSESETSTKTSSSDSGIEDGKSSPTYEEHEQDEKVCGHLRLLQSWLLPLSLITNRISRFLWQFQRRNPLRSSCPPRTR